MANYRNISISFWTDSKVDDEFTPEDKYFYLYLLTNPHTNICGCYEISMKQMERETGYNSDTIRRLISRMQEQHHVIQYSDETKEVLILHWGRYNWTDSDKVKKAILGVSEYIKNGDFRKYVIDTVSIGYPYRIDTVSIGYPYPMHTSVSDTDTESDTGTGTVSVSESVLETETETENRNRSRDRNSLSAQKCASECTDAPKAKKFVPPTVEEVKAYCNERRNGIDAEEFVSFYESKGWMIGKNKMKNWKAAITTWERNRRRDNGGDLTISTPSFVPPSPTENNYGGYMDFDPWAELGE